MMRSRLARSNARLFAVPTLLAGLVLGGAIGLLVAAGPLNPPSGPVAGTYKTLSEIEPRIAISVANTPPSPTAMFRISQPGSYYLVGDIIATPGKSGIEIATSGDVSIDLSGFSITGDGVSNASGILVTTGGGRTISNGTIRSFGANGLYLTGSSSFVRNVCVANNVLNGMSIGGNALITGCVAMANSQAGFLIGAGCSIADCVADNNSTGFNVSAGCTMTGCSARGNTGAGFAANGGGSTVTGCTSEINTGDGFDGSVGWHFVNCNASFNAGVGINTSGGLISHCTILSNAQDGIRVVGGCMILSNQCLNSSGSAAIHALGVDNRIEGNNCTGCARGIQVEGSGSIITRNTCSGNGVNWVIATGNSIGPIVVAGTNAVAINTNGAVAGTLGSTDPNSNYSY